MSAQALRCNLPSHCYPEVETGSIHALFRLDMIYTFLHILLIPQPENREITPSCLTFAPYNHSLRSTLSLLIDSPRLAHFFFHLLRLHAVYLSSIGFDLSIAVS